MRTPKLIVHGGAWNIPDEYDADHLSGVENALVSVYSELRKGITAVDAVEIAVNVLEADPTFDAGRGAFLNSEGEIELDAIIACGTTRNFGAVAGVRNLLHPVSLARKVMDNTEHCFLIGAGANSFAASQGIETVEPEELLTVRELEFFKKIKEDKTFKTHFPFDHPMDTVGAVAMDQSGRIAVATSTGGTPRKMPGRVGDSPIYGAGAFADDRMGGCSTTGWGEVIMRSMLAYRIVDHMKLMKEDAVTHALKYLYQDFQGHAGGIGITKDGKYTFGHNTPKMAYGYIQDEEPKVYIKVSKE